MSIMSKYFTAKMVFLRENGRTWLQISVEDLRIMAVEAVGMISPDSRMTPSVVYLEEKHDTPLVLDVLNCSLAYDYTITKQFAYNSTKAFVAGQYFSYFVRNPLLPNSETEVAAEFGGRGSAFIAKTGDVGDDIILTGKRSYLINWRDAMKYLRPLS